MMNLHTGLRISRAQPPLSLSLPLLLNASSAAALFPAARICTTNTHERRQWMSSNDGLNVRSRLHPKATVVRRRAASTATGAKPKRKPTPSPSPSSSPSTKPNPTVPSRGPPAVPTPYDPKSPTGPPTTPRDPIPLAATLNPPASTRPPPLELPDPSQSQSKFGHYFSVGKAYMTFYKTGLKAIFTNRRLLASVAPPPGIGDSSRSNTWPTRAVVHLRARTRHDLARLPVFALLLLVCGELTPLLVILFPKLTPLTCRIPRQVEALRRAAAARRDASFRVLATRRNRHQYLAPEQAAEEEARMAPGHIARSLGLTSQWWDRLGIDGPFARGRADHAVAFLVRDDAMIRAAAADAAAGAGGGGGGGGAVAAIEDEEVILACEDRGIDVQGVEVGALRKRLEAWVRDSEGADEQDSMDRVRRLLLTPGVSM